MPPPSPFVPSVTFPEIVLFVIVPPLVVRIPAPTASIPEVRLLRIVLRLTVALASELIPPPPLTARLFSIVLLFTVARLYSLSATAPPKPPLEFPESVLLITRKAATLW